MKVSFNMPGAMFGPGQKVQGEVLGSGEGGSMAVLNGVPVRTDKALTPGKSLNGTIETINGDQAMVTLLSEGGEDGDQIPVTDQMLSSLGLPTNEENRAILAMLRRLNIPLSPAILDQARELFSKLGLGLKNHDLDALGLVLLRKLPAGIFPLLKEYLAGDMRFGKLFSGLSETDKGKIRDLLSAGNLMKLLASDKGLEAFKDFQMPFRDKAPGDLAENLVFQEILSAPPQDSQEGRLYFQWPLFWQGQDVPDTLEGEAYYSGNQGKERGFSLRLLMNPPNLGPMEIGVHRMKTALWIHFGLGDPSMGDEVKKMFSALSDSLRNQGWNSVRLTAGAISNRPNFLSPPESERDPQSINHLDVKV